MVSISELQLNDGEQKTSEPSKEFIIDAKIDTNGPRTPDAADEQADEPSSSDNGDLVEKERKQRAEEVVLASFDGYKSRHVSLKYRCFRL
jgi:hypothetical protein